MISALVSIFVFPGFLFLSLYGLVVEFIDRKLYARMQHRKGPPWFQPLADFIKLAAKNDIIPAGANALMFKLMPPVAIAAVVATIIYIPIWGPDAILSFNGDLIVAVYLLTIPTLTFFLGGWYSTSLYSSIGAVRALTQLFAYEVPLFLALLAPALVAHAWSITEIASFFGAHPKLLIPHIPAFLIALIALQGKLERVPFDIPEAETEIVGGAFTEYSGRLLALFRMTIDMEMVVGVSLIAAIFLPFGLGLGGAACFALYLVKTLFIVALLALMRSVMARLRIEQMVDFCWRYVAPAALVQILISIIISGALGS